MLHPIYNFLIIYVLCIVFLLKTNDLKAQYCDTVPDIVHGEKDDLILSFRGITFFHNEEFINQSDGATWIGYWLQPNVKYKTFKNTEIGFGVHLQQFSGSNTKLQVTPLFSIDHKFNDNLRLRMGHLYGTSHYQLSEQLYHYRHFYNDNVQYGFQILSKLKRIKSDVWLHWKTFIKVNDPFQEVLVVGNKSQIELFRNSKYQIALPFSALLVHRGGQIDNSDEPVTTVFNGSFGFIYKRYLHRHSHIDFSIHWMSYKAIDNPENATFYLPFNAGSGLKIKSSYRLNHLMMQAAYWGANKFIAPLGEPLITTNLDNSKTNNIDKKFLILKGLYSISNDNSMKFSMFMATYIDLLHTTVDYSYGINYKFSINRKLLN